MKALLGRVVLTYLRILARLQLAKNKRAVVIGITGSAGKTSTRLAIVHILRTKGRVKHSAHANSESGIPLNILGLSLHNYSMVDWLRVIILAPCMVLLNWEKYDYYVVEMGIDSPRPPKNMGYLLRIVRPDIGVVLGAGLTHAAEFDYLVNDRSPVRRSAKIRFEIAKEKMKLAQAIYTSGTAVVNGDQKELRNLLKTVRARKIIFGTKAGSNLRVIPHASKRSFRMTVQYQSQSYDLELPVLLEPSYVYTFAAAIGVASAVGISPGKSVEALRSYQAPKGRLRIFKGIKNTIIIDSSYNASPDTMEAALKFLKKSAGKAHKIAVIGDMRELGVQAKPAHKALADWIKGSVDECVLFGPLTHEFTFPVLKQAKFPVAHFSKMAELTAYLTSHLPARSWILVKGSQNTILLERAVEVLLADPLEAKSLARRGDYWDKVRAKTD